MSKQCFICGKKSVMVQKLIKLRGKFNPTGKKRKYPNLQWVTLKSGKRVKACAKCIKSLSKPKKEKKKAAPQSPQVSEAKSVSDKPVADKPKEIKKAKPLKK